MLITQRSLHVFLLLPTAYCLLFFLVYVFPMSSKSSTPHSRLPPSHGTTLPSPPRRNTAAARTDALPICPFLMASPDTHLKCFPSAKHKKTR